MVVDDRLSMDKNGAMATIKQLPSGAFQIRVTSKLLPKPFYASFETRENALAFSDQLRKLLNQGIVPKSLLDEGREIRTAWTVGRCIAEYIRSGSLALSEIKLLDTIRPGLEKMSTAHLNYAWAEAWIREMKRGANLAPSTIRHRHGALARCFDWVSRKHPEILVQNPLRLLKRGFATYTDEDREKVEAQGLAAKYDVERDRRLDLDEEQRILAVMMNVPDERFLFILALETAMRMRECYTLEVSQVSISKRTIHLNRTKNGDQRQVPLSSTAIAIITNYLAANDKAIRARGGRLLPFWNGERDEKVLDQTTMELSLALRDLFDAAGVVDFRFHDLRHEATCRLFEKTTLSDVLIAKITGHRDPRMLKRYASLRGSDLASRLW
jgi:integrase